MNEPRQAEEQTAAPAAAVAKAIQELTAARLSRAFLPLGVVAVAGIGQALLSTGGIGPGLFLGFGALAAGAATLAYGLRVSQMAFGRKERAWMVAALWTSMIPPLFAVYVMVWRGLRGFVVGSGLSGVAAALFFTVAGFWAMRSWMAVSEVQRLARVMSMGLLEGDE